MVSDHVEELHPRLGAGQGEQSLCLFNDSECKTPHEIRPGSGVSDSVAVGTAQRTPLLLLALGSHQLSSNPSGDPTGPPPAVTESRCVVP